MVLGWIVGPDGWVGADARRWAGEAPLIGRAFGRRVRVALGYVVRDGG